MKEMKERIELKTPSLIPMPIISAKLKLNRVPINTYSVLPVLLSLYRNIDLAAMINPIAVYCCNITRTMALKLI